MIKVVAKNRFIADDAEKVLVSIEELIECTRQENGCISYELFKLLEDPNIMTFIETWESKECLDAHLKSEHFQRLFPQIDGCVAESFGLDLYELEK